MKWKKEQVKDDGGDLSSDEKSFISGCEKENILRVELNKENSNDEELENGKNDRQDGDKELDLSPEKRKDSDKDNVTIISTKPDEI